MNRSMTPFLALALGVVVATCSIPAMAQGPGGGGPGRGGFGGGRGGFGGRARGLSILRLSPPVQARLGLDAAQKSKIDAIGKKLMADAQGLFGQGGGGGNREAAMTKMRGLSAKGEGDALNLLKPAQKKQYDSLKAEAASYAGFGRSGGALLAVADLTPPQKSKLKTLATQAGAKRDKLFGGGGPGGPGGGDRNAMMEKMRAMNVANTAAIKKVLTPPQQKKFDAAVAAGGRGGPGGGPGRGGPGGGRPGGGRPGGGRA
ncbi:MAG: hypothetical protein ACO1SX_21050 [Actinomycetota bacterium]